MTILGWILSIGMVFASIPVGDYVDGHLSVWAATLTWSALIIGVLASISYFGPGLPGWLVGAIIGFTAGFCFGMAMVNGWQTQALTAIFILKLVLVVGSVGVFVATMWWTRRFNRLFVDFTREIGAITRTDMLFTDDGVRILVYPDRMRLLIYAAFMITITVVFAVGFHWATTSDTPQWLSLGLGLLFVTCGLASGLPVIRFFMRTPSLVIGPDGILDNATVVVTGRGLLRWDEILAVLPVDSKRGLGVAYHYLVIVIADVDAVRQRQALWKVLLGFVAPRPWPSSVAIFRALLDRPPEALADEIVRYAVEHAPNGWHSPLIADEDENDEPEGEHGSEGGASAYID